jgi:hypothetical protein
LTSEEKCNETNFEVNKALVEWIQHLHNCEKMSKEATKEYMNKVVDFLIEQEYDLLVN